MSPEISTATQASSSRQTALDFSKTNKAGGQETRQQVRQAQAEQQKAAQNTAAARAAAQESQNNLRAAQDKEQQAADRVSEAKTEQRTRSQAQQAQATGKIINVQA